MDLPLSVCPLAVTRVVFRGTNLIGGLLQSKRNNQAGSTAAKKSAISSGSAERCCENDIFDTLRCKRKIVFGEASFVRALRKLVSNVQCRDFVHLYYADRNDGCTVRHFYH